MSQFLDMTDTPSRVIRSHSSWPRVAGSIFQGLHFSLHQDGEARRPLISLQSDAEPLTAAPSLLTKKSSTPHNTICRVGALSASPSAPVGWMRTGYGSGGGPGAMYAWWQQRRRRDRQQ